MEKVKVGINPPDDFYSIIEIPANAKPIKYEVNKEYDALCVENISSIVEYSEDSLKAEKNTLYTPRLFQPLNLVNINPNNEIFINTLRKFLTAEPQNEITALEELCLITLKTSEKDTLQSELIKQCR